MTVQRVTVLVFFTTIFLNTPTLGQDPYGESFEAGLPTDVTWTLAHGAKVREGNARTGTHALMMGHNSVASLGVQNIDEVSFWFANLDQAGSSLVVRVTCDDKLLRRDSITAPGSAIGGFVEHRLDVNGPGVCTVRWDLPSGSISLDDVTITYLSQDQVDSIRTDRMFARAFPVAVVKADKDALASVIRDEAGHLQSLPTSLSRMDVGASSTGAISATATAITGLGELVNPLGYTAFQKSEKTLDSLLAHSSPREATVLRSVAARVGRFFSSVASGVATPLAQLGRIASALPVVSSFATAFTSLTASPALSDREVARALSLPDDQAGKTTLNALQQSTTSFLDSLLDDYSDLQRTASVSEQIDGEGASIRAGIDSVLSGALSLVGLPSDTSSVRRLKAAVDAESRTPQGDSSFLADLNGKLGRTSQDFLDDTSTSAMDHARTLVDNMKRLVDRGAVLQIRLDALALRLDGYYGDLAVTICGMRVGRSSPEYLSQFKQKSQAVLKSLDEARTSFRGVFPSLSSRFPAMRSPRCSA